ncbi:hypothetical protein [Methanobrevibacter sp.]|uniref:hypothetical protein n=1 Tax=Methanobrevibacter sp. TaxID=66852 RepID=UPI00388E1390
MGKKIFTIFLVAVIAVLALGSFAFATDEPYDTQNFGGSFNMTVHLGEVYVPSQSNGSLGSVCEYINNNSDGNFRKGDINIYYYNESVLADNETDVLEHALGDLTTTYSYQINQNDDLIILQNDKEMCGIPFFLVGKTNGNEVVFLGGENMNELTQYANSIKFSNT